MEDQIIFIYSICDDLLTSFGNNKDAHCKMSSAEVMTVAIVAALFFGGNFSKARFMLKSHNYMRNMLSESRLNRRMHEIDISIWQTIFHAIAQSFSGGEKNFEYLVDSIPIEVCMNVRSYRFRGQVGFKLKMMQIIVLTYQILSLMFRLNSTFIDQV